MYHSSKSIAEDYASRLMGAGVTEPMHLADYYYKNPQEIPEPMNPDLFKVHFKSIINALKRKAMYHSVENQEVVENYWDNIANNLPAGLKSDSQILAAAKEYISSNKGRVDSIIVLRDKNLSNKIVSSYRVMNKSEEAENSSTDSWYSEMQIRLKNTSVKELVEELIELYEIIIGGDFGSYTHDSAKLDADIIYDHLLKRGVSEKTLNNIWDEVEERVEPSN